MRASEEVHGVSLYMFDTVGKCTLYCVAVVLDLGSVRETTDIPSHGRPYFVAWWVFSFITMAAYAGNLISFLVNPGFELPINTPEAIIKSQIPIKMYNYMGIGGGTGHHILKCLSTKKQKKE